MIAGVSKVSGLKRVTEVVEHRAGGDLSTARKSPGLTRYEPIILERGVTHDMEFEQWANLVWSPDVGAEVSLANFRKDLRIEFYNEAGQVVMAYNVYRAWVSEFQALPELDANTNAIAIQTLKLEIGAGNETTPSRSPSSPAADIHRAGGTDVLR